MQLIAKNNKQLWKILRGMIPVMILSNLATMLGSFVDGIVVGNVLGDAAMSSLGLSIPIVYLGSALSGVFSSGTQNNCATSIGNGNSEEANRYFNTSLLFMLLVNLVLVAAIEIFVEPISVLLGARGEHANLQADLVLYLRGIAISIPFICLTNTLSSLMYIEGKKQLSLIAVAAGTAFNIAGDLAAVHVFHAGMLGIGLATALCNVISAVILFIPFLGRKKKTSILRLSRSRLSLRRFFQIVKAGGAMAITRICHFLRTWIINTILGTLFFQAAITAFSIQNNLASLITCVSVGGGAAAMTVGSIYAGEKNLSGLKSLMKLSVISAIVLSLIVVVPCIILRVRIVDIFTDSNEVIQAAANAFLGYLISLPLYSVNLVFMMYFMGIRRLKTAIIVCVFDNLLFVCLAAVILAKAVGLNGVWAAFPVGEVCTLVALVIMAWIYHKKPVLKFDALLQLKDDPDILEQNYTCANIPELMKTSEEVAEYAMEHGADKRTANKLSLCVEEYGKNIMEWGFRDKGDPFLSIRLMWDKEIWKIYIKDMGAFFDPLAWLEENKDMPKTAAEHIGVRLTAGLASDLKYIQALGMNTVVISVVP